MRIESFAPRYAKSGAPSVEVFVDDGPAVVLGSGVPSVSLRTSAYELMRILFGRRSREQVSKADWAGEHTRVMEALHIFDFPPYPIDD